MIKVWNIKIFTSNCKML